VSDSLAAILRGEPDWSALPAETPFAVRNLLRRCLQKDPKKRLHDIADARIELEEALPMQEVEPLGRRGRGPIPWAIAALLLGAAAGALLYRWLAWPTSPAVPSIRTVLHLPADAGVSLPGGPFAASFPAGAAVAISPDGRTVAFRGTKQGVSRLYRKRLDREEAEPITGTENGFAPFFSPDGQWLGFFTAGELKKVPIEGGAALLICPVPPVTAGGAWDTDGSIVYTRAVNGSLYRVPSAGGEPQQLTTLDAARGEHAHLWPQILPKGRGILVSIVLGKDFQDYSSSQIVVLDPKDGSRRVVLEGSTFARYSGGWLVFVRGGEVSAAPFDVENRRVTGPAVRAPEPITLNAADGSASLALSPQGDLVYVSGPPFSVPRTTVLRVDPNGRETPLSLPPSHYFSPRLASNGRRLAITRCEGYDCRIFAYDLAREILSPLTPEPGRFFCPAWSADGLHLAFSVVHKSDPKVGLKAADGSGALTTSRWTEDAEFPNSFSPDGRTLAFTVVYMADHAGSRKRFTTDIWLASLEGKSAARPWFESPFRESAAAFSPDGRWIAYVSDESGRYEVYVRPFPGPGGKVKVSSEGGAEPVWILGGRQITYRAPDGMMSVDVGLVPELSVGKPRLLFVTNLTSSGRADDHPWEYDVSPDGTFFVGTRADAPDEPERRLALVTNWLATLGATESRK
jgi:serine/threonine-protein kinase